MRLRTVFGAAVLFLSVQLLTQCGKTVYSTNPEHRLTFSNDTILFDTTFATIGSVTLPLKVYNTNSEALLVDRMFIESGANSSFRANVDGESGVEWGEQSILPGDSMWVFLEVTIDPASSSTPFVIEDGIRFELNGQSQRVQLAAWGQDAIFHGGLEQIVALPCDASWAANRPHVVYGIVAVEEGCTLSIAAGTQVHVHKSGGIIVDKGTLNVNGTLGNEVVFQGDRLDDGYSDVAGQWGIEIDFEYQTDFGIEEVTIARGGIWLFGGVNCTLDYAILKNGTIGLQVDTVGTASGNSLWMRNTRIENMTAYGLFAQGAVIDGYNNLITNCGESCAALTIGGSYRFDHCTFANYWSEGVRQAPAVYMSDWYEDATGTIQQRSLAGSEFRNCVIWGNNAGLTEFDELIVNALNLPPSAFILQSAVEADEPEFPSQVLGAATSISSPPPFVSPGTGDFHLNSNSSSWDGGAGQFPIATDLDGLPRAIGVPDKGCFERQ